LQLKPTIFEHQLGICLALGLMSKGGAGAASSAIRMALIGKKFDGRSLSNFETVKPAFFS
jgi:hypothetical protein